MRIYIGYQDGTGVITEREISDVRKETDKTIDAFCHLRNDRRSFNLDRIIRSVASETGELLNPYQLVPLIRDPDSLDSLTWESRQAIKALKFFSLTTRGFSRRVRQHLIEFVKEVVALSRRDEEISDWVYDLWYADVHKYREGDVEEYKGLLEHIPHSLRGACRTYAKKIAGSASNPENSGWIERIDNEFAIRPVVRHPVRLNDGF